MQKTRQLSDEGAEEKRVWTVEGSPLPTLISSLSANEGQFSEGSELLL